MCVYFVAMLCVDRIGLDWAKPIMHLNLHVTCSCIFMHMYLQYFILWYFVVVTFLIVFLSLSLSYVSLLLWHLNANLLSPKTFCVLGHLLPLTLLHLLFSSMMRMLERTSRRTFVDKAFIWNATSFCQTFLTLTYPLSFTVGVGSHFMASWSRALPWSYRSSSLICTDLITLHLFLSLASKVCVW